MPVIRSKSWMFLVCLASFVTLSGVEEPTMLPLMPWPAKVQPGPGRFMIDRPFTIIVNGAVDSRVRNAVERFRGNLSRRTGILLPGGDGSASFTIHCAGVGQKVQQVGEDESYRLEVTATEVHLDAPNPLGVIHGLQTFLQLVQNTPEGFAAPVVMIEDAPRFLWRGLLVDVSRHFMPVEAIKRNLDAMETVKFNVLHWHLSDDQGFRVESKKFPKFQRMSSDGQYYTQEQIKDIIAYARDRGIRVVPEFDMPGHTSSWFAAYPELASGRGPHAVSRHYGPHDAAMDPTRDHTYHFLDDFIGEMSRLFPDAYFHIGGDEVNGRVWAANRKIRQFRRRHHFKNSHDLQAYFNQRLEKIVKKRGKIMVGWDEIMHGDLPKDVVIQSWRGQQSLADAARQGYRGLLSYGYYLDLMQPASQHYAIDPLGNSAAALSPEEQQRILGGEGCMWAEFMSQENIDERIWPRAAAIAERLWSPQQVRDGDSMYTRLHSVSDQLDWMGLMHRVSSRRMLERLGGSNDIEALRVLSQAVEPVKGYARARGHIYETTTPLNRMVDAVPPESDTARTFAALVQKLLNRQATPDEVASIRDQLGVWVDNDAKVQPLLQQMALLQELSPLSMSLKAVAQTGLEALDYVNSDRHPPAGWREQQLDLLKQAEQPQAELLDMIAPSVQKLVEAVPAE
jgi:hexosaminidase